MKGLWNDIRVALQLFGRHRAPRLAAALAYYTIFSVAPLAIILITIVGLVYGSGEARSQLVGQVEQTVGEGAAEQIDTMIEQTNQGGSGVIATIFGVGALLLGASAVFTQLQAALNEIWGVAPERRSLAQTAMLRLRGLLMAIALGIVLLLSFALQAAVNIIVTNFEGLLPGADWLWFVLNQLLTIAILTVTFAALFRAVPETDIGWPDVWPGALLTAVLFKIGEVAIGIYLGVSAVSSTYGAAGSLVVLVLFIYFAAQILLFGAAFTRAQWLRAQGATVGA